MASHDTDELSWINDADDVIVLRNRSSHNYVLDLPSGYYRLDAGRRMRTLRSIMKIDQIKRLIDAGDLQVEA